MNLCFTNWSAGVLLYSGEPIISADFLYFGVLNVFVDVEAPTNYKYMISLWLTHHNVVASYWYLQAGLLLSGMSFKSPAMTMHQLRKYHYQWIYCRIHVYTIMYIEHVWYMHTHAYTCTYQYFHECRVFFDAVVVKNGNPLNKHSPLRTPCFKQHYLDLLRDRVSVFCRLVYC